MGIAFGTQTEYVWWRKNHQLCHHESETMTFFFFFYQTPSFMSPSLSLSIAFAESAEASHE